MSTAPSIPDGQTDTSTSLVLYGSQANGNAFLADLANNLVQLLTNFSGEVAPLNPSEGQFWWQPSVETLSIYTDGQWAPLLEVTGLAQIINEAANSAVGALFTSYDATLYALSQTQAQLEKTQAEANAFQANGLALANDDIASLKLSASQLFSDAQSASALLSDLIASNAALYATVAALYANSGTSYANAIDQIASYANTTTALSGEFTSFQSSVNGQFSLINDNAITLSNTVESLSGQLDHFTAKYDNSVTTINENIAVQANSISSLGAVQTTLVANVANVQTSINQESIVRANAVAALNAEVNELQSGLNGANSTISANYTTLAANASALASEITTLMSNVAAANATISANYLTFIQNATALAGEINTLTAGLAGANAVISQNYQTFITNATALASEINTLMANVAGANATISQFSQTFAANTGALAQSIGSLTAGLAGANSVISTNYQTFAANTGTLANLITGLQSGLSNANSTIYQNFQTFAANTGALASEINSLTAGLAGANALITAHYQVWAANTGALASEIGGLTAGLAGTNATVTNNYQVLAGQANAIANSVSGLQSTAGSLNANVAIIQQALANSAANSALASLTLQAKTGTSSAIIQLTSSLFSSIGLAASDIYAGQNFRIDEESETLQVRTPNGAYILVIGAAFGANSDLLIWFGPNIYALNQMTQQNAIQAWAVNSASSQPIIVLQQENVTLAAPPSQPAAAPVTLAQTVAPNPNLLDGGGFDNGSTAYTKTGTNTLHTQVGGGPASAAWIGYATGNCIFYNDSTPVIAGLPYSFSGYTNGVGIPAGTGFCRYIYQFLNASGTVLGSGTISAATGGQTWLYGSIANQVAPSGTTRLRIIIDTADQNGVENNANGGGRFAGTSGVQVGWAELKVEQSTTVTPFAAAGSSSTGGVYSDGVTTLDSLKPAAAGADPTLPTISANPLAYGSQYLSNFGSIAGQNSVGYGSQYLTGFGSIATQSSLSLTGGYLTGFGSIASQNSVGYGSSFLTGFGSIATQSSLSLTGGYLTGFGSIASQNSVGYGSQYLTGFGSIATQSSLGYGSSYLTGFGALSPLNYVTTTAGNGGIYSNAYGWQSDYSLITAVGQAASIANQSLWATSPNTPYSPSQTFNPTMNALPNGSFKLGLNYWNQTGGTWGWNSYGGLNFQPYIYCITANPSITSNQLSWGAGWSTYLTALLYTGGVAAGSVGRMYAAYLNSSGTVIGYLGALTQAANTNWTQQTLSGISPTGTVAIRVYFDVTNSAQSGSGTMTGSDVFAVQQVKLSSVASPYTDEATRGAMYSDFTLMDALRPAEVGANVTGAHQAASIVNQAFLATNLLDFGNTGTNNFGSAARNVPQFLTDLYGSSGAMYMKLSHGINDYNGQLLVGSGGYWPATTNADQTSIRQAASIANQSTLATNPNYAYLQGVPGAGSNWAVNSDFKKGTYGWAVSGSCTATVSQPAGSSYMYTCALQYFGNIASGSSIDPLSTAGSWNSSFTPNQFLLPIQTSKAGQVLYAGCLMGQHNCVGELYLLGYDSGGNLTEAPVWTGATEYGNDNYVGNGDPAHYSFVGGTYTTTNPATRWVGLMVRMLGNGSGSSSSPCQVWVSRMQLGTLSPGQTTVPPYSPGSADPYGDQTSSNQAASIVNQAYLATNSLNFQDYYGAINVPAALSQINWSSQYATNASLKGTIDCAGVSYGAVGSGGYSLVGLLSMTDSTGRLLQGTAYVPNTQIASSYVWSVDTTITASSSSISVAGATSYMINGYSIGFGSSTIGGLSAGTFYSVFYNYTNATFTAINSGTAGYFGSPNVWFYVGGATCPSSGTTSGGGNLGGGKSTCVLLDSHMTDGRRAAEYREKDYIAVLTREGDDWELHPVAENGVAFVPCVMLTSTSGIKLGVSNLTPIPQRNGRVIYAEDVLGCDVAVLDHGTFRWERVVSVEDLGPQGVATIACDDRSYAAGVEAGRFIFSHNTSVQP